MKILYNYLLAVRGDNYLKKVFWFGIAIVTGVSLGVTFLAPINDVYKGVASLLGVAGLATAIFQLIRDHAAHQRNLEIQQEQQLFNLGATSKGDKQRLNLSDKQRLDLSLDMLSRQSELEYSGEYGAELTTFIPFVAWLKQEGHLKGRKIRTYDGMRPYYFFLDDEEFVGKTQARKWVKNVDRYWPSNTTYTAVASPWHVYPDYRRYYANSGMHFEKPVIFIQNKFTIEWKMGPINYFPLRGLSNFLEQVSASFDVVYSRPNNVSSPNGYSKDHKAELNYPDTDILARFPQVMNLERMCIDNGKDYNRTKLEILAKTHFLVGVQGGGAHLLSYFGNSILLLLHIRGKEYSHAYQKGPYKYLSSSPPKLLLARNFDDFIHALKLLGQVDPQDPMGSLEAFLSDENSTLKELVL